MRKVSLVLFASLLLFALAGTASATCLSCSIPCEDIYGPNYECNDDGSGYYGQCHNIDPCRGCRGWFDQSCIYFGANELEPKAPAPLLGVRVTAVVRANGAPLRTPAYRVAQAR